MTQSLLFNRLAIILNYQSSEPGWEEEIESFIDIHIPPGSPTALEFIKAHTHLLDDLEDKFSVQLDVEYSDIEDCALHIASLVETSVKELDNTISSISKIFSETLESLGYEIIAKGVTMQKVRTDPLPIPAGVKDPRTLN